MRVSSSKADSLRCLLPQLMGHIDDVRVSHAAGDVVSGVVEEEDEAHLIHGAGTSLEKKRETGRQSYKGMQSGGRAGRDCVGGYSIQDAVLLSL